MGEWISRTLEELAMPAKNAIATGPFGSAISARYFKNSGVPVLRGSNLSLDVGKRLVDEGLVFLDEEKANEFTRSQVFRGDLIFTCWGTIGQLGLIDERAKYDRYIVSNKQMKLTPNGDIVFPLFLYYALSTPQSMSTVQNAAIGSSVPGFNLSQLKLITIDVPPLVEQIRITAVLGALDDKIAVNERANRTLDELTRRLFQLAFSGAIRGETSQDGTHGKISDLCTTQYGHTASATKEPVGPRFLRVTDINKRNWINWESVPYCDIAEEQKFKYSLSTGDIVVARMADPGKSAIIEQTVDAVFASYLVRLKTESLAQSYYIYGFLKSEEYVKYSEAASSGSVQANMNAKVIVGARIPIPTKAEMEAHLEQVLPLRRRIAANLKESASLSALRDTLLPKLMSGELRVRDAEKIVEDAA